MDIRNRDDVAELAQLRSFIEIVARGTFTGAAEFLHISQPAISAQIQRLEAQLEVALLWRDGQAVRLTPAGEQLLPLAQAVLAAEMQLEQRSAELAGGAVGPLRFGCGATHLATRLAPLLGRFATERPHVELQLVTGTSSQLANRLNAGDVEAALISTPPRHPGFTCRALYRDAFCWVCSPATPPPQRLLAFPLGSGLRAYVDAEATRAGLAWADVIEVDSLEGVRALAEAGLGMALLPELACQEALAAGRLTRWSAVGSPLPRTAYLLTMPNRPLSAAMQLFIDALQHAFAPD